MKLRRLTLVAALAIVPALGWAEEAKAKFGEWLHDEMQHRGLWLFGSPNLTSERAPANLPPRKAGRRWVLSRDAQSGNVVYFVPGDIQAVEIDTHRKTGTDDDFAVSVSPDGSLWVPLAVAAANLETSGEWEYRLISAEQVPAGMTHLRIEFPASTKPPALRLTEVWIRFEWEETLLSPEATPSAANAPVTTSPAKSSEPMITYGKSVAAAPKSQETPKDHSLALAATKAESAPAASVPPASPAPAPAAESSVHSLALAATTSEPVVMHEPAPAPVAAAAETPRAIPPAPMAAAVVADATPAPAPVEAAPAKVIETAAAPIVSEIPASPEPSIAPTVSAAEQTSEDAPATVSAKPAKKAPKKVSAVRLRRGPRSK